MRILFLAILLLSSCECRVETVDSRHQKKVEQDSKVEDVTYQQEVIQQEVIQQEVIQQEENKKATSRDCLRSYYVLIYNERWTGKFMCSSHTRDAVSNCIELSEDYYVEIVYFGVNTTVEISKRKICAGGAEGYIDR